MTTPQLLGIKPTRRLRGPGRVPSFEQCLTQILDSIQYSNTNEKPQCISAKDKQRIRQVDLHPEFLSLPAYRRIIRKRLDQHLQGLGILTNPQAIILEEELRAVLSRYEHLMLQMTIGHASARQVRWSLCCRFFVPWVAFRIAFRLRDQPQDQAENEDYWFLPSTKDGGIGSCFMDIIDRNVRKRRESDEALVRRLCGKPKAGDGEEIAKALARSFRHYRASDDTASDTTLNMICKKCPQSVELRSKLVFGRAIDRNVQRALKEFSPQQTLKLVKFFNLSFRHFRRLLQHLDNELSEDDEKAWQMLQSQTLIGNTPFEADRYYPLAEPFISLLAQKISAELENAGQGGRLAYVPTTKREFRKGRFEAIGWRPLPIEIEDAYRQGDFSAAVRVSQSIFTSTSGRAAEAARVAGLFSLAGLRAYAAATANRALTPSENEAPPVLVEAARLLRLAYAKASGVEKTRYAISFLRFLLEPQRPKAKAERALAWKLYRVADEFYKESGRAGSSAFLRGCLLWLEGNEKLAMVMFWKAAKAGRASCGEDWIWLLRFAPILANKVSKRRLNYFLALSEREGVYTREPSPRTNIVMNELRRQADLDDFQFNFRPFPT